jgi:hypothetical protein
MRDYGSVSPYFWIGKTGKALRGQTEAQLLALYLMTCPHANMIGVFHCPVLYMSQETGLPFEGASKALRSLIEAGFCQFDEDTDEVFVVRMAAYQIGESLDPKDNRCKSVAREYEKVQSAQLQKAFLALYSVAFNMAKPPKTARGFEAPSKPLRSQEQEQEQEQDQHALHNSRGSAVDKSNAAPPPKARADSKKIPKPESPAALAVRAMEQGGLRGVAAAHPDLVALLGKGITPDMFGAAATKAIARGKGWQYVVGTLRSQLEEAAGTGDLPTLGAVAWDATRSSVEAKGVELGLGPWCGNAAQELFTVYTERVRVAMASATAAVEA